MAKPIGPMFAKELKDAGIDTNGVAWGSDGDICYGPAVTPEQRAAVEAVYAAHDPDMVDAAGEARAALVASDAGMARVAEDLVEIMLTKSLIQESDIPQAVLDKIAARKALRDSISS